MTVDLTTRLGDRLTLPTPLLAASGTVGYGEEIGDLAALDRLGALITPTLTLEPRLGNPPPRSAEASAGLLLATGRPNIGLTRFLAERLPALRALSCPLIVSIAAETAAEWKALASGVSTSEGIAALELDLQPPELLYMEKALTSLPDERAVLERIESAAATVRKVTSLPVIVKLPSLGAEIGRAAQAAVSAGADILAMAEAFPGVAVRLSERKFRFPGVVGALRGPCIKPMALYQVWRAAQSVSVPVIGTGGIMTAEDALEFFLTGASAVAVGAANFIHPDAITRITEELAAYLNRSGIPSVSELIGAAGKR